VYLLREQFHLSAIENGVLLAANPFIVMLDEGFEYHQAVCAIGWMSLIILFGYPWLRNRFLDFNCGIIAPKGGTQGSRG
jgi:hypothetical protein